jgi:hypothetical protein
VTFLSKAERDYLVARDQIKHHDYYCVKSRLLKKLQYFTNQELPLLIEKGYLAEFCKQQHQHLAENCKMNSSKDLLGGFAALKYTELRGSPSLVGRGIANPMSERTRGFEIASLLLFEKEEGTEVPLPAPLFKTLQFVSVDELHKS